jgi:hypothetical protein
MAGSSPREAMDEVIDWLTFNNHKTLHLTLGYVSPMRLSKAGPRPNSKTRWPYNG